MKLSEEGSSWENAVKEWEIFDHEEDETADSSCVCGKEELLHLFTIKNATKIIRIIYTYLHLASKTELTKALVKKKVISDA